MNYWTSVTKNDEIKTILADGLNQGYESVEIKDSECTAVVNMDSSLYPDLSVRDGRTLFSAHTGYINRLFKFGGVWYCGNAKGLYKLVAGAWVVVHEYSDTSNSRLWDYAIFLDKLYFVNGSLQLQEYNGTTKTAIAAAPNNSDFITVHANRMFLANTKDNLLSFSGLRLATDWTSTDKYVGSGKITVETSDGQKPTALTEFADHIMEFKKYSLHELFGEDSTNFTMKDTFKVGNVSHRATIATEKALYWIGTDGIYEYLGGSFPRRISDNIKGYMKSLNLSQAQQMCAGYDGRFLYFSLVTGSNTTPNVTVKYDTEAESWWVEDYVATAYFLDGQDFYMAIGGNIYKKGGADDNGALISWKWESKPLTDGDEIRKKAIHKLWLIAELEAGSNVNVYYSPDIRGETWTQVGSITPTGKMLNAKIPVIIQSPSEWFRIKIEGKGKVKFYRLVREISRRGS